MKIPAQPKPTAARRASAGGELIDALHELAGLVPLVGPHGDGEKEDRVARHPEETREERLRSSAHRAPGQLRIVIGGEIRSDATDEARQLVEREKVARGKGQGQ